MAFCFRSDKHFNGIVGIEVNGKGNDVLARVFWYVHDALLPGVGYTLIFRPSDSDFHSSTPFARYCDATHKCSTAAVG